VRRIALELQRRTAAGERVVLAFSGLRRRHRDRLRATGVPLRFLFLHGDKRLIAARMHARSGHYMPASLLDSQFAALEEPTAETDVVRLSIEEAPSAQLDHALAALE
jgi:gluconokinase